MLTYPQAKNDIKRHLFASWVDGLANGYTIVNQTDCEDLVVPVRQFRVGGTTTGQIYIPEIGWERQRELEIDNGKHLVRIVVETASTKPIGMRKTNSRIRERTRGLATAQIYFSPSAYHDEDEDFLTGLLKTAFQRRKTDPNMVRFVKSRIAPLQPATKSVNYYLTNVYAEFEYDEIVN